jgi:flagellar basal-body rod protein FlgF
LIQKKSRGDIVMIRGLYTAASGMITRQAQQENISNNIANINTPGFKQEKIALKSFEDLVIENKDKYIGGKGFRNVLGTMSFGVGIEKTQTSFIQGIIHDTGRDLDFAIDGDNMFFTMKDEEGNLKYTRDGRFSVKEVDGKGYLVNSQGYYLQGKDLNPIETDYTKPESLKDLGIKFYISEFQNEDLRSLLKDGGSSYIASVEPQQANGKVSQGALEKSNIDVIDAISEMITIMRSYETSQKVVQQMDETLGKSVNEIGSVR